MAASELTRRLLVAAVGVPLAIVLIYLGGWPMAALLALIAALGARELYAIAAQREVAAFTAGGMALAAAFVIIAARMPGAAAAAVPFWALLISSTLGILAWAIWARGVDGRPLASAAVTIFGAVLTGGALAYGVFLRHLPPPTAVPWLGAALVAYPLALTWIGDSAAYFVGRALGKRKLIPAVSPGKTVAGAVGGLMAATLAGALFGGLIFYRALGVPIGAVAGAAGGVLISVAAQIGDLAESLLKREAGVKDSGTLLPGHGGVLDRFDALFFTLPVAYFYLGYLLPRIVEGLPWR
jgi:phosphatidate cytidylyltransferase